MLIFFIYNEASGNYYITSGINSESIITELEKNTDSILVLHRLLNLEHDITPLIHDYFAEDRIRGNWYKITSEEIIHLIEVIDYSIAVSNSEYRKDTLLDIRDNTIKEKIYEKYTAPAQGCIIS